MISRTEGSFSSGTTRPLSGKVPMEKALSIRRFPKALAWSGLSLAIYLTMCARSSSDCGVRMTGKPMYPPTCARPRREPPRLFWPAHGRFLSRREAGSAGQFPPKACPREAWRRCQKQSLGCSYSTYLRKWPHWQGFLSPISRQDYGTTGPPVRKESNREIRRIRGKTKMELFRVYREPAHFSISAFQHFSFSSSLSPPPSLSPLLSSIFHLPPWSRSLVLPISHQRHGASRSLRQERLNRCEGR